MGRMVRFVFLVCMVRHWRLLLVGILGMLDAAGQRSPVDGFAQVYGALDGHDLVLGC